VKKIKKKQINLHLKAISTLVGLLVFVFLLQKISNLFWPKANPAHSPAAQTIPVRPPSKDEIVHGDTTKKQVIFTFDGGSNHEYSDPILAALTKHQVKGTFFLTGEFVERFPGVVKNMVADGQEVFSHTYDHPHLSRLSDADVTTELVKMEQSLKDVTGTSPKPFFRAPYGDRDERVINLAYAAGYESVFWTVDAMDWKESAGETEAQVRDHILSSLAPGNIYLMHIGDTITGKILDDVFTTIEARGYKIVSLTQGL